MQLDVDVGMACKQPVYKLVTTQLVETHSLALDTFRILERQTSPQRENISHSLHDANKGKEQITV